MTFSLCHKCGELAVTERLEPLEVSSGTRAAVIQDRRMVCGDCGNVSYLGAQISEHELAVAAAIRQLDGLLSPEELRSIRMKYRLRQSDMEQMLSTGPKTWTRWERGKVPQSKPTDKLIRAIAEDPDLAFRLMMGAGVINDEAKESFRRIEDEAKRFARAMLLAEIGDRPSADLARFANRIADRAFETMRDARRQAVSQAEAA